MIIDQIIQEAQNYEGMFKDIFMLDADPRLRHEIVRDINWARKTFGKNDRITWFLRWSKISYQLSRGIWSGGRADTSLWGALLNQRLANRRFSITRTPREFRRRRIEPELFIVLPWVD